jgi:transposase
MSTPRTSYPSDVSDEEWAFVAPYLTLMSADALQRRHDLREVFNAVRWLVRSGAPWRMLPHDFPRWSAVYQQTQRGRRAGGFAAIVHDLRLLLRLRAGRGGQPTAVILDGRTVQSTPERGARAGYDGYKRRNGSKTHVAVDTLGHLLAVVVTPANAQERAQVAELAQQVQEATGNHVELADADDGYTGEAPRDAAAAEGITLQIVKLADAQGPQHGFVLLPKRWIVERSFAWAARFRRLARDYERLPETVAGLTFLAFTCLMLHQLIHLPCSS